MIAEVLLESLEKDIAETVLYVLVRVSVAVMKHCDPEHKSGRNYFI